MKKIILFLLITLPSLVFSQETKLSFKQLKDSTFKYYRTNPELYIKFGEVLKDQLIKKQDFNNVVLLNVELSRAYLFQDNMKKAEKLVNEAVLMASSTDQDSLKAISYLHRGNFYFQKQDFILAIHDYDACDSLAPNKRLKNIVTANYARIKENIGDFVDAIHIRKKLLNQINKKNDTKHYMRNLGFIINDYTELIIEYNETTIKYLDSIDYYYHVFMSVPHKKDYFDDLVFLTKIGVLQRVNPNPSKKNLFVFDSIKRIFWRNNNHFADRVVYFYIADYYNKTEQNKKSLHYLQLIDSINLNSTRPRIYPFNKEKLYVKVLKALHKDKEALVKMDKLTNKLKERERKRDIISEELKFSYDNKEINHKIHDLDNRIKNNKAILIILGLGTSFLLILLVYFIYNKRKLNAKYKQVIAEFEEHKNTPRQIIEPNKIETVSKELSLDKTVVDLILQKLHQFENKQVFLQPEVNLNYLAQFAGTNRTYVSKVLKTIFNLDFRTYLNNLRIEYVIDRLQKDAQFRKFSIATISEEIGYGTPETFSKVFKTYAKMYPSQFIKQLNKQ